MCPHAFKFQLWIFIKGFLHPAYDTCTSQHILPLLQPQHSSKCANTHEPYRPKPNLYQSNPPTSQPKHSGQRQIICAYNQELGWPAAESTNCKHYRLGGQLHATISWVPHAVNGPSQAHPPIQRKSINPLPHLVLQTSYRAKAAAVALHAFALYMPHTRSI